MKNKRLIIMILSLVIGLILVWIGINAIQTDTEEVDLSNYKYIPESRTYIDVDAGEWSGRTLEEIIEDRKSEKNGKILGGVVGLFLIAFSFSMLKNNKNDNVVKESPNTKNNIDKFEEIKELLDKGLITQEEFDKKKQDILNKM